MQDEPSRVPKFTTPWVGSIFWNQQKVKTEAEFKQLAAEMNRPVSEFPWEIPGMKNVKNTSRTLWMHLHMSAWKGLIRLNLSDDLKVGLYGILGFTVPPQHLVKFNEGLFPVDQVHHKMDENTDGLYPCKRHSLTQTWYTAGFAERKTHDGAVLVGYSESLYERMKNQSAHLKPSEPEAKKRLADQPGAFKKPRTAVIDVDKWAGEMPHAQPPQFFSPVVVHSAAKAAEDRAALADARLKVLNMEYNLAAADYQRAVVENGRAFAEMQRTDAQFKHASAEFQKKNTEIVQAKLEVRAAYTAIGEFKAK
jgi:hypothetical protein